MKKLGSTLSLENTNLEKVTTTVKRKRKSKRKLSEISDFSNLGIGQNRKVGNFGSLLVFFLTHFIILKFLSRFIFVVSEY